MNQAILKELGPWSELFQKHHAVMEQMEKPVGNIIKLIGSKRKICPDPSMIFRVFQSVSPENVRVVIVGQDPYPQAGVADGLAFSTRMLERPASLYNIVEALKKDWCKDNGGWKYFFGNDLQQWADQGVMLLNARLTCDVDAPGSHKIGWEPWIGSILQTVAREKIANGTPVVFMLWGSVAKDLGKYIPDHSLILKLEYYHPAQREDGFRSCKHFSEANKFFSKHQTHGINWYLFEEKARQLSFELRHAEDDGYPIRVVDVAEHYIPFLNDYIRPGMPIKFDPKRHESYCKRLTLFKTQQYSYLNFKRLADNLALFCGDTVADTWLIISPPRKYPALLSGQKKQVNDKIENIPDPVPSTKPAGKAKKGVGRSTRKKG